MTATRRAGARARRVPLALAVPAVATAAAVVLPLAYLVLRAASARRDAWEVLDLSVTGRLVFDTGILVVAVVAGAVLVGVPLAWLITRTDLPGRRVWAVAAALPLVIPSYVAALALLGALGPRGLLQDALEEPLGVERLPEIYGFPGATLALILSTYPYVFLLVSAALRGADRGLEEAARGLGRSAGSVFVHVTLPTIRPALAAGCLLVALYTLADFGAVSLMQYPALTRAIYLQYEALFDREPAAILGLVLVAIAAVVLLLESYYGRRAHVYRAGPAAGRPATVLTLGRWRWPALAVCTLVVALFLVLPVGVLAYWTWQGLELGHGVALPLDEAAHSVVASGLAAVVAAAVAVPVAVLASRYPRWWTRILERASLAANALPGIVIALALVFFAARYGGPLYQTLALLVFAYVVRFLPEALAATGAALRAVDPRLEEAARSLGRGPARAVVAVVVPLVRHGVLAGVALVFLSAMKELPATLLLRPIGFDTLATEVWTATNLAAYSQAAPPALLLIVLSAPVLYLLGGRAVSEANAPG